VSDSTQGYVEVVGGSPALRKAIADIWREYTYQGNEDDDVVLCGEDWPEVSVGAVDEAVGKIKTILADSDPGDLPTRIEAAEEARYEYPGDLYRWQPDLGWHHLSVDNGGGPDIDSDWVRDTLRAARVHETVDEAIGYVERALDILTGTAWEGPWYVGELIPDAKPGEPATRPIRRWHTREEAEAFVGRLPGAEDGRYVIDGPEDAYDPHGGAKHRYYEEN